MIIMKYYFPVRKIETPLLENIIKSVTLH